MSAERQAAPGRLPERPCGDPTEHIPHDWIEGGFGSNAYRYCAGLADLEKCSCQWGRPPRGAENRNRVVTQVDMDCTVHGEFPEVYGTVF